MTDNAKSPSWGAAASKLTTGYVAGLFATEYARVDEVISVDEIPGLSPGVTVHLFRNDTPDGGYASLDPNWYAVAAERHALIKYESGSSSAEFICDWRGQFALCCRSISISLASHIGDGPAYNYTADVRTGQRWGAHLGTDAVGNSCPTYTSGNNVIVAQSAFSHYLPRFACRYFLMLSGWTNAMLFGQNLAGFATGTPVLETDLAKIEVAFTSIHGVHHTRTRMTPDLLVRGLPVPPNATYVTIYSGLLLKPYNSHHHYQLAL
jgi:hypothetical protein